MAKTKEIMLREIKSEVATITIVGDSPLILNKMGDRTKRELIRKQKGEKPPKTEKSNEWEDIITSLHWMTSLGIIKPEDYSEAMLYELLDNNTPCISAHGLMEQLGKAVTRFEVDQYSTKFKAAVNIITGGTGLIPINFERYELQETLIPTKTANRVPVLAQLNTFYEWSANVTVDYIEAMFSLEDIVQIFYLCGRSLGIGSGTSSDYGRFHVETVR